MTAVLFDTNIIIDALNGRNEAASVLAAYDDSAISIISWIEVMAGTPATLRKQVGNFIDSSSLSVIGLTTDIAAETAEIRHAALHSQPKRRLNLPDAIIQATANLTGRILITRDTTDFKGKNIKVPYQIDAAGNVIKIT